MSISPSVEPAAPVTTPQPAGTRGRRFTTRRIVSIVAGGIVALASLGFLSAGGWATWATSTQRDASGYVTSDTHTITTAAPAITSGEVGELADRAWSGLLGDVRIRATSTDPAAGVFIGVAPTTAVDRYLAGVTRASVTDWFPVATRDLPGSGAAPKSPPADAHIWTAQTSGSGTQALTWRPTAGTTVVVMRPDGSAGASAVIDFGAKAPDLAWVAVVCFVAGGLMLGAAALLIVVPLRRARS